MRQVSGCMIPSSARLMPKTLQTPFLPCADHDFALKYLSHVFVSMIMSPPPMHLIRGICRLESSV